MRDQIQGCALPTCPQRNEKTRLMIQIYEISLGRWNGALTSQNIPLEVRWEDEQCFCQFFFIFNCSEIIPWALASASLCSFQRSQSFNGSSWVGQRCWTACCRSLLLAKTIKINGFKPFEGIRGRGGGASHHKGHMNYCWFHGVRKRSKLPRPLA